MPNEKQHTLREGSRVRGATTGREGWISNPTFSPSGRPMWTVAFEPGTGTSAWSRSGGSFVIHEEYLVLMHGPPEAGVAALVQAARGCAGSGVLPSDSVDRIVRIAQDDSLSVRVGDYVQARRDGSIYKVVAINDGMCSLRDGTTTYNYRASTVRQRFEPVNVTPVKGVIKHV